MEGRVSWGKKPFNRDFAELLNREGGPDKVKTRCHSSRLGGASVNVLTSKSREFATNGPGRGEGIDTILSNFA